MKQDDKLRFWNWKDPQIKDTNENKMAIKIPLVKQEVITTPPKKLLNWPLSKPDKNTAPSQSVLDTAELDMLLSRGNFKVIFT